MQEEIDKKADDKGFVYIQDLVRRDQRSLQQLEESFRDKDKMIKDITNKLTIIEKDN